MLMRNYNSHTYFPKFWLFKEKPIDCLFCPENARPSVSHVGWETALPTDRMEECSASGQTPALPPSPATPAGQQQAWHPPRHRAAWRPPTVSSTWNL